MWFPGVWLVLFLNMVIWSFKFAHLMDDKTFILVIQTSLSHYFLIAVSLTRGSLWKHGVMAEKCASVHAFHLSDSE